MSDEYINIHMDKIGWVVETPMKMIRLFCRQQRQNATKCHFNRPVAVVQQQRQRINVQKKRDAQAKLFFHKLDFLIFDKHSGSYELCFLLFKRDNILHAWHFSARMAHFPCMFLIDLILSTYVKDFFSVVSSLFFLLKRINENFAVRLG